MLWYCDLREGHHQRRRGAIDWKTDCFEPVSASGYALGKEGMILNNRLLPGMKAPPLTVPLVGGGQFDLHQTAIENLLVLDVYLGLHCPRCHRHLLDMNSKVGHMQRRGIDSLAVSMDSEERASAAKEKWGLAALQVGYGMSLDDVIGWNLFASTPINESEPKHPFAEPAVFLITPDHTIYSAIYGTSPFNRFNYADMLEAMDMILARNYPARGTFDPHSAGAQT